MASSNARSRETVLAYSGSVIDRASNQRSDPGWVDTILAADGTRLIPMWRDQCIVSGEPAIPAILAVTEAEAVLNAAAETVFLGLDDDGGIFAADLSPLGESQAVETAGGERVLDVRGFVGTLRHREAALLGYALSVDGEEVLEARWFTRAELIEHAASRGRLGREDSIDRYLLHSWLEEAS